MKVLASAKIRLCQICISALIMKASWSQNINSITMHSILKMVLKLQTSI